MYRRKSARFFPTLRPIVEKSMRSGALPGRGGRPRGSGTGRISGVRSRDEVRLEQRFDARHPLGEPADLLVHFHAEAADLSLHIQELAAQSGEPERARREHRSEHGDEHRDEESLGSGERVVGTPGGSGVPSRFRARHRSALLTLSRSIGAALLLRQRDSGRRRIGGSFVHGEVLHHVQTQIGAVFSHPAANCGKVDAKRHSAGKRWAVSAGDAHGLNRLRAAHVVQGPAGSRAFEAGTRCVSSSVSMRVIRSDSSPISSRTSARRPPISLCISVRIPSTSV